MTHEYEGRIRWTGNDGRGTRTCGGYRRDFTLSVLGKPELSLSANRMFRGDGARHDPEDLFLASLAGCHMLTYLALAARAGIVVVDYEDTPRGLLALTPEGGQFDWIRLAPLVTVAEMAMHDQAQELHVAAHRQCFLASSCSVPIEVHPTIVTLEE